MVRPPYRKAYAELLYTSGQVVSPVTYTEWKRDSPDLSRKEEVKHIRNLAKRLQTVVTQKLNTLNEDQLNNPETPLFDFTNSAGEIQGFSVRSALRLSFAKSATADLTDFLLSPFNQGFRLQDREETRKDGLPVRSITLTVAQGRTLLRLESKSALTSAQKRQRRELMSRLKLWEYDYVAIPVIKRYSEPDATGQSRARPSEYRIDNCYFVIIAGLSGKVVKKIVWSCPLWYKPTRNDAGEDEYLNLARSANFQDDIHLRISHVRSVVCKAVAVASKKTIREEEFIPTFVRIDCYRDFGNGTAAAMGLSKMLQRPLCYLDKEAPADLEPGTTVIPGPMIPSGGSKWAYLYDPTDDLHHRVGHAATVAVEKVIAAALLPHPPTAANHTASTAEQFEDLGGREVAEFEVDAHLWPRVYIASWKAYRKIQQDKRLAMLYYVVYHQLHREDYVFEGEEQYLGHY